ncbi:ankyrin-3 [Platysternon megacephalum]|uniref:Ankyrin-3 n=1 Tax=Platysternon megacephalum TaxID=55544 RepID=A0A4D9EH99_9SAUR|nr:ankyrin-3 [Platysternon megacephalum]
MGLPLARVVIFCTQPNWRSFVMQAGESNDSTVFLLGMPGPDSGAGAPARAPSSSPNTARLGGEQRGTLWLLFPQRIPQKPQSQANLFPAHDRADEPDGICIRASWLPPLHFHWLHLPPSAADRADVTGDPVLSWSCHHPGIETHRGLQILTRTSAHACRSRDLPRFHPQGGLGLKDLHVCTS